MNLTLYRGTPPQPASIEVEFNRPNQIVSATEESTSPPPETKLLAAVNSSTPLESVKRGLEGAPTVGEQSSAQVSSQPISKPAPQAPSIAAPPPPASQKNSPGRDEKPKPPPPNLKLDQSTLLKRYGSDPAIQQPLNQQETPTAFSRPPGSGARFLGNGGTADYLPSLPDGDLTLLNAKANQYAVFVRRVAVQVFAELRQVGWESLRASDIRGITSEAVFEAKMDRRGELISVTLLEGSGSGAFDAVLRTAVDKAARDRNPPAGAEAEDGYIHFIFKSRSWVSMATNPRSQAPFERRWLLLATGLL